MKISKEVLKFSFRREPLWMMLILLMPSTILFFLTLAISAMLNLIKSL